jgi:hypothetical protein
MVWREGVGPGGMDTHPVEKTVNRVKAVLAGREGPAENSQDAA